VEDFNYLKSFVSLLENTEIPPKFSIWCGIASILGTLERRIWLNQGVFRVYPNFFIILVAGSGQKKSTAIRVAGGLLKKLTSPPLLIPQKLSKEQLISDLAESCGGTIIADELATFIGQKDYDQGMGAVLTTLWDCEDFEYKTFKRGAEKIENGYLSLLGGTTVELLRKALPRDAIGGGFSSRVMFVYEDQRAAPVSWPEFDENLELRKQELVDYLNKIALLQGPINITVEAKEKFKNIYHDRYFNSDLRSNINLLGYENRRHVHLLKVAIALMVSEAPKLVIQRHHITGADLLLQEVEERLPFVMDLIAMSESGAASNSVWLYISSKGSVERSELTKHFSHQFNSIELAKTLDTLVQAKKVDISVRGRQITYDAIT